MSGYQTKVLEGIAQLLAAASVGAWTPTGVYTSSQTGILLRTLPQSPDRVIVLSTYTVTDDPALSDSVTGLQVVTRWGGGDPRPTDDLTDLVYDTLHGLHDVDLATGVHVTQCLHRSGVTLGQDTNSRWRTSSNFYLDTHRPSPNRS